MSDVTSLPWTYEYSASAIDTFLDCRRKWAWDKIAKVRRPANSSAKLGDSVHKQLEGYLQGQPFDFTEVVDGRKVADIATSGLQFLPEPNAPGMTIEGSFRWQSNGLTYNGRKDVQLADSGVIPHGVIPTLDAHRAEDGTTGVPAVLDHKTTSSWAYVKTADILEWDVQANLYAYDLIVSAKSDYADLVWVYYKTRGGKDSQAIHIRISWEQAFQKFRLIESVARDMATIQGRAPKFDSAPAEGLEGPPDMRDEWLATNTKFIEGISPNASSCEKYGGCHYRHMCRLTPAEGQFRFMSNDKKDDTIDSLRKRAAIADGVPSTPAPSSDVKPDVSLDSLRKKPSAAPASDVGTPHPDVKRVEEITQAKIDKFVADTEVKVNPPESELPAPTLPPALVASTPEIPPPPMTEEAPKAKRGRPAGSKNKTKDPQGADALAHTTLGTGHTVIVTDLDPYNAAIAKAEAEIAAEEAAKETDLPAFELFVNCAPMGGEFTLLETYVAIAQAMIRKELEGTDAEVADYRFIPYGKGPGALAVAVVTAIQADPPKALVLSTATDEGHAVLGSLVPFASRIVRAFA